MAGLDVYLSAKLIWALCTVETGGNITAYTPHDGHSPSYGVCQVKMKTAQWMGFKGTPEELMNPETNMYYAALYLQYHFERTHSIRKAISAYNAGHATNSNVKYVDHVLKEFYEQK